MHRRRFLLTGTALLPVLVINAESQGTTLLVHLTYTGSGTVDRSHKIYVVLWDSPDFRKQSGMQPLAVMPVTSKSGVARFDGVQKNPVYVSVAYDPRGAWDAKSEPPTGASLGLYAKERGVPAPVQLQPGKPNTISITLDDSFKMGTMSTQQ